MLLCPFCEVLCLQCVGRRCNPYESKAEEIDDTTSKSYSIQMCGLAYSIEPLTLKCHMSSLVGAMKPQETGVLSSSLLLLI